jgi:capsular polysaccharide biosynthesis protein
MFKDTAIWIIIALLGYLIGGFYYIRSNSLKESNQILANNLDLALSQNKAIREAAQIRDQEYREIEAKAENLDKLLEDLKDEKSISWLDSNIPADVDNTIPY